MPAARGREAAHLGSSETRSGAATASPRRRAIRISNCSKRPAYGCSQHQRGKAGIARIRINAIITAISAMLNGRRKRGQREARLRARQCQHHRDRAGESQIGQHQSRIVDGDLQGLVPANPGASTVMTNGIAKPTARHRDHGRADLASRLSALRDSMIAALGTAPSRTPSWSHPTVNVRGAVERGCAEAALIRRWLRLRDTEAARRKRFAGGARNISAAMIAVRRCSAWRCHLSSRCWRPIRRHETLQIAVDDARLMFALSGFRRPGHGDAGTGERAIALRADRVFAGLFNIALIAVMIALI